MKAWKQATFRMRAGRRLRCIPLAAGVCGAAMVATTAYGHATYARSSTTTDWVELILVAAPMIIAAGLFILGAARIGRRVRQGKREFWWRAAAFTCGLLLLAIALWSPLDDWGGELFAAHMVQHELLMLAAAPLLVLGRPLPVFLWAFRGSAQQALIAFAQKRIVRRAWAQLLSPGIGWLLHALALWIWHVPRFFDAVLQSPAVHAAQHLTFLVTALVFWAALLEERRREQQGAGILYLFTTTIHTSVLGALITFASHPWYSAYLQTSSRWGLTALEDQQLGGLIMWVPGSLVYVGIALALLARWIMVSDGRIGQRSPR